MSVNSSVAETPDLSRRILLLSLAAFASGASARIADPLLTQLAVAFNVTTGSAAHTVSAFALAYGVFQLFYGPIGDRYGKFRVITWATLATLVGGLGTALAGGYDTLVTARFVTGATAAAIIPLSMAWIADSVPYQRRQVLLAYFLSGQIFGVIGGQVLGGAIADLLGWRAAFQFMVLVYGVVGGLLLRELARFPANHGAMRDASLGFLARTREILLRSWPRWILLLVFCEGALLFGALAFVPTYVHLHFGVSLTLSAAAIAVFGLGGLSYTSFAGYFVRRLGERRLASTGGFLLGLAFLLIMAAPAWYWVVPGAWCSGLGYYMLHNTLQINATQMAPASRGTAVSLFASCFFLGQSAGVAVAAASVDRFGQHAAFASAALFLPLLGLLFSHLLKRRPAA